MYHSLYAQLLLLDALKQNLIFEEMLEKMKKTKKQETYNINLNFQFINEAPESYWLVKSDKFNLTDQGLTIREAFENITNAIKLNMDSAADEAIKNK